MMMITLATELIIRFWASRRLFSSVAFASRNPKYIEYGTINAMITINIHVKIVTKFSAKLLLSAAGGSIG